jgi:hypothetical protein
MFYGYNFELIVPPHGRDRKGRFFNDDAGVMAIGAPVLAAYTGGVTDAVNGLSLEPVVVADGAQNRPTNGRGGIAVYEYGPAAYAGDDTSLVNYSDKDTVPTGAAVQVVSGPGVKVLLRNLAARTFLQSRDYAAQTMVAGLGATPTLAVGDLLTPQATPNFTNGFWQETSTESEGWLVITAVDATRNYVEAQMLF